MQEYLTLHLYGIVCPSGSKAFTELKGCVFSWYSSVMLTPSENLILSLFPFCLHILTWHNIILQMQTHTTTTSPLPPPSCPKPKPNNSMICSWMTSLKQLLELWKHLFLSSTELLVPTILHICAEMLFEWIQVSNWCDLFCTTTQHLLLFTICQS